MASHGILMVPKSLFDLKEVVALHYGKRARLSGLVLRAVTPFPASATERDGAARLYVTSLSQRMDLDVSFPQHGVILPPDILKNEI